MTFKRVWCFLFHWSDCKILPRGGFQCPQCGEIFYDKDDHYDHY